MRVSARFCGLILLVSSVCQLAVGQSRTRVSDQNRPVVSTATPVVRVTTQNPREINLGKPATFVISVANAGQTPASDVVVTTRIPKHVDLAKSDPRPIEVDGLLHRFQIGDLAPGATRRVSLVAVPQELSPVKLDTTVTFATSTRSSLVVRRPLLRVTATAPQRAVVGQKVEWTVLVTNTGDGPAESVVLTPSIVSGEVRGSSLERVVKVGNLKPGETKKHKFTAIGLRRGEVKARFVGSNPDGLKTEELSTLRFLQAELAIKVQGPVLQPVGRESRYEIHVTNPGDAPTNSTLVTVQVPRGLEITSAPDNGYNDRTRTLRWRITSVRPSDNVPLRFRAETVASGAQTIQVDAKAEMISSATTSHTTTVISRPNLVVTVLNNQELSAIGDPIRFQVKLVNAGSKAADDLQVRVAIPEGLEVVESNDYAALDRQIEFPATSLGSGERTSFEFRVIGRQSGDQRVRVLIGSADLDNELAFEAAAFCYSESGGAEAETAQIPVSSRRTR